MLIGDAEPDVQKALSWAYRSMTVVDLAATTAALALETDRAAATADGHRAWVIRDACPKLAAADAAASPRQPRRHSPPPRRPLDLRRGRDGRPLRGPAAGPADARTTADLTEGATPT